MDTEYDGIIKSATISEGEIVKTSKDQIAASANATVSNDLTKDNNMTTITISAKDIYGNSMPSFLLYIDEYPLQRHGILHNIYGASYFDTVDALNGLGSFNEYTNGFATNVQVSDSSIATGNVYQHHTFGNVQRITLDFSSSASGTNVDISLPQIASGSTNKQTMIMRYRIHKSANASLTNNVNATLTADEDWHMLAIAVASPVTPTITVTTNAANDTDATIIEFASYYAYNLDSTALPHDVSILLKALLAKDYSAYADLDNDALAYVRMYDAAPQLPTVIRTNGDYNVLIAVTENTVAGMVKANISTPTNQVTLGNDYIGNQEYTRTAIKKAPFTYVMSEQQIVSVSDNVATLSDNLSSGTWKVYYPASITLTGYVVAEQKAVDSSKNVVEIPSAISFSVPINVIVDAKDAIGNMPDDYDFEECQYANMYTVTVDAK